MGSAAPQVGDEVFMLRDPGQTARLLGRLARRSSGGPGLFLIATTASHGQQFANIADRAMSDW